MGEAAMSAPAPARVSPAERGGTRIADRVVAKIAARAAREALSEAPRAHLVPRGTAPHASVSVRARRARIRLSVELGYPLDVAAVCAQVRRRVVERVEALTGMAVPEVVVEVERFHSAASRRADERRVQ